MFVANDCHLLLRQLHIAVFAYPIGPSPIFLAKVNCMVRQNFPHIPSTSFLVLWPHQHQASARADETLRLLLCHNNLLFVTRRWLFISKLLHSPCGTFLEVEPLIYSISKTFLLLWVFFEARGGIRPMEILTKS